MSENLFNDILANDFTDTPENIKYLVDNKFIGYGDNHYKGKHRYHIIKDFMWHGRPAQEHWNINSRFYYE